ncbi:hypothetical protein HS088_TW08G00996 [Tripterygium wilfordii]|uniref:Uncharacterized protein n=1 Tax=Tripterygium wilfordii TaxID=458696 RepID=A0A7J7DDL0_TRIWF|nr:uncharacterized protein LOC120003710 [Tripterygium wilfordii]KAF5744391.1 hypothetical protein HS088_TW08G00996 [Tripterygium wilfordii]
MASRSASKFKRFKDLYIKINILKISGYYDKSLEEVTKMLKAYPQASTPYLLKAYVLLEKAKDPAALKPVAKDSPPSEDLAARKPAAKDVPPSEDLASLKLAANDIPPSEDLASLKSATNEGPPSQDLAKARPSLHATPPLLKRDLFLVQAEQAIEVAIQLSPSCLEYAFCRASIKMASNAYSDVIQECERALSIIHPVDEHGKIVDELDEAGNFVEKEHSLARLNNLKKALKELRRKAKELLAGRAVRAAGRTERNERGERGYDSQFEVVGTSIENDTEHVREGVTGLDDVAGTSGG